MMMTLGFDVNVRRGTVNGLSNALGRFHESAFGSARRALIGRCVLIVLQAGWQQTLLDDDRDHARKALAGRLT